MSAQPTDANSRLLPSASRPPALLVIELVVLGVVSGGAVDPETYQCRQLDGAWSVCILAGSD